MHQQTDLSTSVFGDLNGNGVWDSNERLLNGQTIILINLENPVTALHTGAFNHIHFTETDILIGVMSGSIDIANAVHFRTQRTSATTFADVDPGLYIIMRSPDARIEITQVKLTDFKLMTLVYRMRTLV